MGDDLETRGDIFTAVQPKVAQIGASGDPDSVHRLHQQ
jgi:hypothetical protein